MNTKQCEEDYTRDSHRGITLLTSRGKGHLSIGRNLYEGLQKVLPEVQYLWVDAICINQNDTAERAIQVPLMGSIYADANSVLVWLGLDESNVEDFKWIHEIFYAALLAYAGKDDIQNFAWTPGVDSPLADRTLQVHATPRWQGYADFVAERRWFRVSTGIIHSRLVFANCASKYSVPGFFRRFLSPRKYLSSWEVRKSLRTR